MSKFLLTAVRDGRTIEMGTYNSGDAACDRVDTLEAAEEWPEGHEAVVEDLTTHEQWVYTDHLVFMKKGRRVGGDIPHQGAGPVVAYGCPVLRSYHQHRRVR